MCGEGTAWDPVKNNCNWENTVQCKKGLRKWDEITDIRGGEWKWGCRLKSLDFALNLVTLFATDAALAWRAKKSTTTFPVITVDSNFTCEYDAEGYFPGNLIVNSSIRIEINFIVRYKILSYLPSVWYWSTSSAKMC